MRASTLQRLTAALFTCLPLIVHGQGQPSAVDPAALVGAWKLTSAYVDNNRNTRLDAEERNAPMPGMQDYLKLNADGTCDFYAARS